MKKKITDSMLLDKANSLKIKMLEAGEEWSKATEGFEELGKELKKAAREFKALEGKK